MKMKCLGCGAEKDTTELSVEECRGFDWRVVVVCDICFDKLDVDMWISDRCWLRLNPVTPFEQLPYPAENLNERFRPETYRSTFH